MKIRELTCIVCPRGCQMTVTMTDDGAIEKIENNACRRGAVYANDECTMPKRTVTSTVRAASGGVISVKTDGVVPKELVFSVMKEINSVIASDERRIGDVIIENVCDTGVNVVATSNGVNS